MVFANRDNKNATVKSGFQTVVMIESMLFARIKYILFTIFLDEVLSFKHATEIPAREVKAINMHVFLCYLETGKHFSLGLFSHISSKSLVLISRKTRRCWLKATITRCDLSPRFFCTDATLLCEFESDKI